jgi:hypothetical protein
VCANSGCTNTCPGGTVGCAGACCRGNACCGSRCQTAHDSGAGTTYFDCKSPGTPGKASTYSLALAKEAAKSLAPGAMTTTTACGNAGVLVVQAGSNWVTWAYSGPLAGRVNTSGSPTCPDANSPTWT